MARFIIRPRAYLDLEEIAAYIGNDNPDASSRFLLAAQEAFSVLAGMPLLGFAREVNSVRLTGLRTHSIPRFRKYLVIYRPVTEGVEILRIVHGARDIDRLLEEEGP